MTRALFHPRMLEALGDFYPSRCAIQENLPTQNPNTGEEVDIWADVPGLEALPCAVSPDSATGRSSEDRRESYTLERATKTILLQSYVPEITPAMRAVVDDGLVYNILVAEADSSQGMTRLRVELVAAA